VDARALTAEPPDQWWLASQPASPPHTHLCAATWLPLLQPCRCDSEALDLEALLLQHQRRERQQAATASNEVQQPPRQQRQGQPADAVAAAMHDVFGASDSESDSDGESSPDAGGRPQRRQQGHRRGRRQQEQEEMVNPYDRIIDPTAPRRRPQQQQQSTAAANGAAAVVQGQPPRRQGSSSLPEEVRKKLAAQVGAACIVGWGALAALTRAQCALLLLLFSQPPSFLCGSHNCICGDLANQSTGAACTASPAMSPLNFPSLCCPGSLPLQLVLKPGSPAGCIAGPGPPYGPPHHVLGQQVRWAWGAWVGR